MFGFSFLALLAVVLYFAWRSRPKYGLSVAILLSLLLPMWVMLGYQNKVQLVEQMGLDIDLRVSVGLVGLLILAMRPKLFMPLRPHWIDAIMLALISLHLVSDSYHEGFSFGIVLRVIGEWCIPYAVGRLVFCNLDDVRDVLIIATFVAGILAILSVFECISGTNLHETVFGIRPHADTDPGFSRYMSRWGLKRAFGPGMHPIYFGTLQLLLFPWTVYAASRAIRLGRSRWKIGSPLLCAIGISSTLSRGPMIALIFLGYVCTLILKPRFRTGLVIVGVICAVLLIFQREFVIDKFEEWGGGKNRKVRQLDTTDGRVQLTSTNARIYIWEIYEYPLKRSGWLGWGTRMVDGFPISVPLGPKHESIPDELRDWDDTDVPRRKRMETIDAIGAVDNAYLLITLRFGFAAPLLLVGLSLGSAGALAHMAITQREGRVFYATMSATILSTALVVWTISMPHDFGFVLIMYWGMAAGLHSRVKLRHTRRRELDAADDDTWTV